MNKFLRTLLILFTVLSLGMSVFAGEQEDALAFFNKVVKAGNTYSDNLLSMYSDDAKIIREVIKPDGQLVDIPFTGRDYKGQLKISSAMAKLRNYKNIYSNVKIAKVSKGYRIDAMRKPSLSDYKLKTYMVVEKQPNGKWQVVEEMMQTKEQIFLKYAK